MSVRWINRLVMAIGVIVLVLSLLVMARETSMVANWSRSGFTLCSVRQVNDSTLTFFGVDSADFVSPPIPSRGDTLLTIGDSVASERRWISVLEVPHTPGREAKIAYLHRGEILETTIRTRPVGTPLKISVMIFQALKILILISFVALGFWGLIKQPNLPAVRSLALYCFASAALFADVGMPMYPEMASFQIPFGRLIVLIIYYISAFYSAGWLLLNFFFPKPVKLVRERPWLAYAVSLAPTLVFIAIDIIGRAVSRTPRWIYLCMVCLMAVQTIAGLILLWIHHRRAESKIERRQTRLVLLGSGVGLVLFSIYWIAILAVGAGFFAGAILAFQITNVVMFSILLFSPFTLAYAVGKYRLLDLEARLRRGTRYVIATILLVVVLVAVGYGVGIYVQRLTGTDRWTTATFVAAMMLLAIGPSLPRLRAWLKAHFFPERERLRGMIADFLERTAALADKQTFWNQLEERLRDALTVDGVYPVLRKANNGFFLHKDRDLTPFSANSRFVLALERERKPIMVDEAVAGSVLLDRDETSWLQEKRVALIVPLISRSRLIGFVGLGNKAEQEDYAAEELGILNSLAPQVAMASDNMSLLEENIEKKRMEEELTMARKVQQGFLPKVLPVTAGLDVAAQSTFCLEVAGDYYDIIPLADGRTALAVGDVSGKGASAALHMANLQASLRALCGVGLRPAELMGRINELIYTNTEPDQYITFFVGVFDPCQRTFTYVNAGHNPPVLARPDGSYDVLWTGGLVLGAFSDCIYQQATLSLAPCDALLIFTDGISEAMNEHRQELGEDTLCGILREHSSKSAREILDAVIDCLARHQFALHPDDDQTILVAKVL